MSLFNPPLIQAAPQKAGEPENLVDRFPDCVAIEAEGEYIQPKTVVVRARIQFGLQDPRPNAGPLRFGVRARRLTITATGTNLRHSGSAGQQMAPSIKREVTTQGGQETSRTEKAGATASFTVSEKPSLAGGVSEESTRNRKDTMSTSTASEYEAFQYRPLIKPFGWEFQNQKPDTPYLNDTLLSGLEMSFDTTEEDLEIKISFTIRDRDLYVEGAKFPTDSLIKNKMVRRLFYQKYIRRICDDFLSQVVLCHAE